MVATSPQGAWLQAELSRLHEDHPVLWRLLRWAGRRRLALLLVLAAATGGALSYLLPAQDALLFLDAARRLSSRDWAGTYSDPLVQVGPLFLLPLGILAALADLLQLPVLVVTGAAMSALLLLLWWAALGLLRSPARPERCAAEIALGACLVLAGPWAACIASGQLVELAVVPLWLMAGRAAMSGRGLLAGVLVGAASGIKLWGLLGLPILLLWPGGRSAPPRALALRLVSSGAVAAAVHAPFLLSGQMRMFDYSWQVKPNAPLSLLITEGTAFPWHLRLAQAALVCALGVWLSKRIASPQWMLPGLLLVLRVLTDPCAYVYYWAPLMAWVLAVVWVVRPTSLRFRGVVSLLVVPACFLVPQRDGSLLETVAFTGLLAVLLAIGSVRSRPVRPMDADRGLMSEAVR